MIVDAHHHLWDPGRHQYPWLENEEVAPIRRRFGPDDLEPVLKANGIDGTIVVQARGSIEESRTLLELAEEAPFILGVVGWVDLADPDVATSLATLSGPLVGIRHEVQGEPDPSWLLRDDVQHGLAAIGEAGLAYDLLVQPHQLPAALETAHRHPDIRFVVDHLAKPELPESPASAWAVGLAALAALPNVSCKLSGLVPETGSVEWRAERLIPYIEQALEWFGPDRCMFGSDWPVCLLAASYEQVLELLLAGLDGLSKVERADVLGGTARRVYRLDR